MFNQKDNESGNGCGCHSEMTTGVNSDEPVVRIIKCKKHETEV